MGVTAGPAVLPCQTTGSACLRPQQKDIIEFREEVKDFHCFGVIFVMSLNLKSLTGGSGSAFPS